jgi:hypothetical protein
VYKEQILFSWFDHNAWQLHYGEGRSIPYDELKKFYRNVSQLKTLTTSEQQMAQDPMKLRELQLMISERESKERKFGAEPEDYWQGHVTWLNSGFFLCTEANRKWYFGANELIMKEIQIRFVKFWGATAVLVLAGIAVVEGVRHNWSSYPSFDVAIGVIIVMFILILGFLYVRSNQTSLKRKHEYNELKMNANESFVQMPILNLTSLF